MLNFFRSKPDPEPARASYAVLDLQDRIDKLEKQVRDLQTDWATTYDKFHRLSMRLAKRQKEIELAEDAQNQKEAEEKAFENAPQGTLGRQPISNPLAISLLNRGRTR